MNLRVFFNKNVEIELKDGDIVTGYVETYTPSIDSEEGIEEIGLTENSTEWPFVGVTESEIESIEIIEWGHFDEFRNKNERHQAYGFGKSIMQKDVWANKKVEKDKILIDIYNKKWDNIFKERSIETYNVFKSEGYIMDSHFIGRFLQRGKYKDTPDISISDVITTIKNNPNYKEGSRDIYFNQDKYFALIQNREDKEFISFVRRKNKKGDWE